MIYRLETDADESWIREVLEFLDAPYDLWTDNPKPVDPALLKLPPKGSQRQRVLLALVEEDLTRDEISERLGIADSAADGRAQELEKGGYVTPTGEKRLTQFDKPAAVLTITEKARRELGNRSSNWFPSVPEGVAIRKALRDRALAR